MKFRQRFGLGLMLFAIVGIISAIEPRNFAALEIALFSFVSGFVLFVHD